MELLSNIINLSFFNKNILLSLEPEIENVKEKTTDEKILLNSNPNKFSKIKALLKFLNFSEKNQSNAFRKTIYSCGDMVSIILVQKNIKKWIRITRKRMQTRSNKHFF